MELSLYEIAVGVAVVAIGVYLAWTKGGSVSETVGELNGIVWEAKRWVEAAEQLYKSGQLPADGDVGAAKRDWVLSQLHRVFPKVDEVTLRASIEVVVRWLKAEVE